MTLAIATIIALLTIGVICALFWFVKLHEASEAQDIETRVRKQEDDAKLFLSKDEFKAMQAKTPAAHRGYS